MKIGFDNDKYLSMQSEHIRERIKKFDNKLYLEFGGKLFDDYHASRVLPGFQPDSKLQMLLQLKEQAEIVIVISAEDIISSKVRGDYGITYDLDVLRLIDAFQEVGLYVGSVCVTKYTAAADLNDVNMIDPFHLEAYGVTTVNYNRDIEIFPVVNAMFELIAGQSPYKSPTDMGVNMAGNCIVDDAVCCEASRKEIVRRYYKCLCQQKITGTAKESERYKLELLMNQAGLTMGAREVEKQAHARSEATGGAPAAAIELSDGTVITGKTGPLLGATASALINALKYLAGIPQETDLVSATAIEPIQTLKTNYLGGKNPRLHTDEILIALSSSAASSELAAAAMHQLPNLKGCDVHSTVLLSSVDSSTLNRLGMYLTCDPVYEEEDRKYHKL